MALPEPPGGGGSPAMERRRALFRRRPEPSSPGVGASVAAGAGAPPAAGRRWASAGGQLLAARGIANRKRRPDLLLRLRSRELSAVENPPGAEDFFGYVLREPEPLPVRRGDLQQVRPFRSKADELPREG